MAIYGNNDTRMDIYQIADNHFLMDRVRSVVLVISADDLIDNGNGTFSPRIQALETRHLVDDSTGLLCHDQRYRPQPSAFEAYGTGFLIRDNVIATAKHVVDAAMACDPLDNLRLAFGWWMEDAATPRHIAETDIYCAKDVLAKGADDDMENDWALIELTASVQERQPLKPASEVPEVNTPLFCISHPSLLPLKYSLGWVSELLEPGRIRGPVTAFEGSSGSPVFSLDGGEVVGIYVHGPADYKVDGQCVVACNYEVDDLSDHGKMVRIQQVPFQG